MSVSIRVDDSLKEIAATLVSRVESVIEDEIERLIAELRANSPRGATGDLAAGWRYRQTGDGSYQITNDVDGAYYRIVGRGPGRFPPEDSIEDWVSKKISRRDRSITYLIRRKIAEKGTDRWQSGDNFLGIRPGQDIDESPLFKELKRRIVNRLADLRLE
jgi:hypothetical protein